eukprot:gene12927-3784_t
MSTEDVKALAHKNYKQNKKVLRYLRDQQEVIDQICITMDKPISPLRHRGTPPLIDEATGGHSRNNNTSVGPLWQWGLEVIANDFEIKVAFKDKDKPAGGHSVFVARNAFCLIPLPIDLMKDGEIVLTLAKGTDTEKTYRFPIVDYVKDKNAVMLKRHGGWGHAPGKKGKDVREVLINPHVIRLKTLQYLTNCYIKIILHTWTNIRDFPDPGFWEVGKKSGHFPG